MHLLQSFIFVTQTSVCDMIQNKDSEDESGNVAAIFGPNDPRTAGNSYLAFKLHLSVI